MSTDEKRGIGGQGIDPEKERHVLQALDAFLRAQMNVGLALSLSVRRGAPGAVRGSTISTN